MKVVYVAGRYRASTEADVYSNIQEARKAGIRVAQLGGAPLIPQMNSAFMGGATGAGDDQFWLDATMALLRKCDAVYTVWNWFNSEGAKLEVAEAKSLGIPVLFSETELKDWLVWQRVLETAK